MNNAQRAAVPGIGPRRSEIITGGAQVYAALLERMGLKGFATRRWGCATACWRRCWATRTFAPSVHRTMEAERWEGVLEVCRRYGVDPQKSGAGARACGAAVRAAAAGA